MSRLGQGVKNNFPPSDGGPAFLAVCWVTIKGRNFFTGTIMSFDPEKMKKDILSLKEGVRLCYYTGCTGWLESHAQLSLWFEKQRKRGIYGFSQRKITDRHEHNVYEYYIWLLKHPENTHDSKRIMAVRRGLTKV